MHKLAESLGYRMIAKKIKQIFLLEFKGQVKWMGFQVIVKI